MCAPPLLPRTACTSHSATSFFTCLTLCTQRLLLRCEKRWHGMASYKHGRHNGNNQNMDMASASGPGRASGKSLPMFSSLSAYLISFPPQYLAGAYCNHKQLCCRNRLPLQAAAHGGTLYCAYCCAPHRAHSRGRKSRYGAGAAAARDTHDSTFDERGCT